MIGVMTKEFIFAEFKKTTNECSKSRLSKRTKKDKNRNPQSYFNENICQTDRQTHYRVVKTCAF